MITSTLNKTTSRKNVGAADNNRAEVRDIIRSAQDLDNGAYIITDRAENKIYVDVVKGLTGLIISVMGGVDISWYENGTTSSKTNGYVYTPIVIHDTKGKISTCQYGTHSLVAMLAHTDQYDYIDEMENTPICNHKDNCSWNNKAENLEWVTTGENIRHGKIVASLYRWFDESYIHIDHNMSNTEFMVLDQPLSVKDIEKYCNEIKNKHEFKCANNEYINEEVIDCFVDWLIDNNIWEGSNVYE